MVGALQQYKHHLLKGHKANCSILPFQQPKHLVLYASGCPKTFSEILQPLGSPWCPGVVVWWISFQPWPSKPATWMSSWLETKNQEESRIHFVHNFYGLPACLQISFFQQVSQVSAWCQHRWMHITLIFLDIFGTKKICTPLEEESVFLLSLEYSVPAFAFICVYLADGCSLNFHTRIRKRFKTRLSWEALNLSGLFQIISGSRQLPSTGPW